VPAPQLIAGVWTLSGSLPFPAPEAPEPVDFRDRVREAAAAGYAGVGLSRRSLVQAEARYGFPDMRRILADHGITIVELEALSGWWGPPSPASEALRRDLFRGAEALRARHIKVMGAFGGDPCPIEEMRESFTAAAQAAHRVGARLGLEFIPGTNIPRLAQALEITAEALPFGGGVLIDIWHATRGGTAYAEIAQVTAERIVSVELNDADPVMVGDFLSDMTQRRRFCGEGGFDIAAFLQAVRATGYEGPFGVELLSEELRRLPLAEAARRSFASTQAQFEPA